MTNSKNKETCKCFLFYQPNRTPKKRENGKTIPNRRDTLSGRLYKPQKGGLFVAFHAN